MSTVLKSNILPVHKSHRLCTLSTWNTKWNGNDTSLILPTLSQFWFLVLKPQYMDDKFWDHINNLSESNKTWILEKYNCNLNNKNEGNNIK
jgi:hypothetical protein